VFAAVSARVGERDQRGEREQGASEGERSRWQRLVFEEKRELQEEAQQHPGTYVARCPCLQQLEAEQQHQHRKPRILAEEMAELGAHADRPGEREREQQQRRRWPTAAPQQDAAPGQQGKTECGDPGGEPGAVGGDRSCGRGQQPGALAALQGRHGCGVVSAPGAHRGEQVAADHARASTSSAGRPNSARPRRQRSRCVAPALTGVCDGRARATRVAAAGAFGGEDPRAQA